MLISSRRTMRIAGSRIRDFARSQPARAMAMSRSLSWVIQVKPSPMVWKAQRSAKWVWIRSRSPVAMPPLMNCTTAQGIPWAMQRKIMPKAAELLPLPLPVWTTIRPRSSVFSAMSFSRAAAILAILAVWRAASSAGGLGHAGAPASSVRRSPAWLERGRQRPRSMASRRRAAMSARAAGLVSARKARVAGSSR